MFGTSALNRLRSLDVYRKIPKDYTESTLSGAASNYYFSFRCINFIVSIISGIIMVILFVSELNSYMEIDTTSEMFIDVNRGGEKVIIFTNNFTYYYLVRSKY